MGVTIFVKGGYSIIFRCHKTLKLMNIWIIQSFSVILTINNKHFKQLTLKHLNWASSTLHDQNIVNTRVEVAILQRLMYQIETEEVEDLPWVIFLQDLFEWVFDEARQRLGRVLKRITHEVIKRSSFRGITHQCSLLTFWRRGWQYAISWKHQMVHSIRTK